MMKQLYYISAGKPQKMVKPILWTLLANVVNMLPFAGLLLMVVSTIYAYYNGAQDSLHAKAQR